MAGTEQGLSQYSPWSLLGTKELQLPLSGGVCGEPLSPSDAHLCSGGPECLRVMLNLAQTQVPRLGLDPAAQQDLATWLASESTSIGNSSMTSGGPRPLPWHTVPLL